MIYFTFHEIQIFQSRNCRYFFISGDFKLFFSNCFPIFQCNSPFVNILIFVEDFHIQIFREFIFWISQTPWTDLDVKHHNSKFKENKNIKQIQRILGHQKSFIPFYVELFEKFKKIKTIEYIGSIFCISVKYFV